MLTVIFEVEPHPRHKSGYLEIAEELKPLLETIDGFISVERFESLAHPGKLLSLSYWRDEAAIAEWRNLEKHRHAQTFGRQVVFADYRLRVASILREYAMLEREQAPEDSRKAHD